MCLGSPGGWPGLGLGVGVLGHPGGVARVRVRGQRPEARSTLAGLSHY